MEVVVLQEQEEYNMILDKKCKRCRAKGEKLFLKGDRCLSPKCAFLRKPDKPGPKQRKNPRKSLSEYGKQLIEKQKAKYIYGINERQFRRYFREISNKKGSISELLFQKMERRLDNVVFRLGFASSRRKARQFVSHGHFLVNGRKSRTPSTELKVGDIVSIRSGSAKKDPFLKLSETLKKYQVPNFLSFDLKKMEGKLISMPTIEELKPTFNISLIVEFYSKKS
jgi:small subunit ribosomal protein S4